MKAVACFFVHVLTFMNGAVSADCVVAISLKYHSGFCLHRMRKTTRVEVVSNGIAFVLNLVKIDRPVQKNLKMAFRA